MIETNNDTSPRVKVLLFADDIITTSCFSHEEKTIEFVPALLTETETQIPLEICTNHDDDLSHSSSGSSSSSASASASASLSLRSSDDEDIKPASYASRTMGPLPIDIQFSIPAMIILVLYCFGHVALYDLTAILVGGFIGLFTNQNIGNFASMAVGFLLLRLSGGIWFWSEIVESEPYYNLFKTAKRSRLQWAKKIKSARDCSDEDSGDSFKLSKMETLKGGLLVKDIHMLKWFKCHPNVTLVFGLLGFYFTYIPCNNFYSENLMNFVAVPRHEIISGLPSVKLTTEGTNPSPIFRAILTPGPTPLLSQDEMSIWKEQVGDPQPWPDMALRRERVCSDTCSAINGTLDSFLALEDDLYYEDEIYLRSKISPDSYYAFFGNCPAYFITTNGQVFADSIIFGVSAFLLSKVNVNLFDI